MICRTQVLCRNGEVNTSLAITPTLAHGAQADAKTTLIIPPSSLNSQSSTPSSCLSLQPLWSFDSPSICPCPLSVLSHLGFGAWTSRSTCDLRAEGVHHRCSSNRFVHARAWASTVIRCRICRNPALHKHTLISHDVVCFIFHLRNRALGSSAHVQHQCACQLCAADLYELLCLGCVVGPTLARVRACLSGHVRTCAHSHVCVMGSTLIPGSQKFW